MCLSYMLLFIFSASILIMHLFACPCLNITVHGRGATPSLQDVKYPNYTEVIGTDSFFLPNAFVITLDLGGVTKVSIEIFMCH